LTAPKITFIDTEIEPHDQKILDIGAVKGEGHEFHSNSLPAFLEFLHGSKYICGHNIIHHDLKYLGQISTEAGPYSFIDTLYPSPLLFPKKPYHKLVKDDKLTADELSNPLNDAKKARDLFYDEITAFKNLAQPLQQIYTCLLNDKIEFKHFFTFISHEKPTPNITTAISHEKPAPNITTATNHEKPTPNIITIRNFFTNKICPNAPIEHLAANYPYELAYALALINVIEHDSLTPPWVLRNFPRTENIIHLLRSKKCFSCSYCHEALDTTKALKRFFHYDNFKSYDGMPLQQSAVNAAVDGKSILAVFPTGGGKSITFQLPALMAGANERGLTVIISPLQSLMKDQVDNLENQHSITEAVTINGSLDPLERAKAFERVEDGSASILYISPESLRSKSIESLLLTRNIVRFVIDEAHCFSSWGQDFRVDYLYIGAFIKNLQNKKDLPHIIPVSCFTATAKQKVIEDIKDYFRTKLSLELELFRASAARANLSYHIFTEDSRDGKNLKLRQLLSDTNCPTIIYVSRTKQTELLAAMLTDEGFPARPYHGQMDRQIRVANQDAFMSGEVDIIVATTAFGMGVDKNNVGMVIHYDISDSLENYVQEAGRAGRDEKIRADCYALFCDEDLNKHFNLLNQTKLLQKEIQQVWKAIKNLTKSRAAISQSALEIARLSGWDDTISDMEMRVKTAINALEQSGFLKRGQNMPRIFADSIMVKNMAEARAKIDSSARFDDASRQQAIRIIGSLISKKNTTKGKNDDSETRIDYISDRLGIVKEDVIRVIGLLREENILADAKDLIAYIKVGERKNRSKGILALYKDIEKFLFNYLDNDENTYNTKEMNEALQAEHPAATINQLGNVLNYFSIKRIVKRHKDNYQNYVTLKPFSPLKDLQAKSTKRCLIADFIIDHLFSKHLSEPGNNDRDEVAVGFSILEIKETYNHRLFIEKAETEEIEDALYYLLKIDALKIEGGFLVIYNAMRIERLERDNRVNYRKEHYAKLDEHYRNKRQQIHIIGEYAHRLIEDYRKAMTFVDDYFVMNYELFLHKYFRERKEEISRNITPKKFKQLFGELSPAQLNIINDQDSAYIVVAAGPGSGKTKLLTHKLASVYMMEDVKHEQMLMLTFSRAAATEFKMRLMKLIGNVANFIQIMTFHSYCFDLLGKVGNLEKADEIIEQTVTAIEAGAVDLIRLTKTVLVIDEAQDMSAAEYSLVKTLMEKNSSLRIIAVGDDDQNIYKFRGADSAHFASLLNEPGAKKYELVDNYRSHAGIVDFANQFALMITKRFKTIPIMPMKNETAVIDICKLKSNNVVIPILNAVLAKKPTGSTCIVARTNEEAFNIIGVLQHKGITARQIQANNGFSLSDLVEIRDFIDGIDRYEGYTISAENWQSEKARLAKKYHNSNNLQGVLKLLSDFEEVHNNIKYKSDFKQFIRESKLEDFIAATEGTILVSTIHQTKGREFDNVFLALSQISRMDDEIRREIYVAITRAKRNLHIYYCGNYFDGINVAGIKRSFDNNDYAAPTLICLQLSHKDVNLSYFLNSREELDSLVSGDELMLSDSGCFWRGKKIARFAAKFFEQMKMLKAKGYIPRKAYVRHIVYWQDKDRGLEIKIMLPNVEFVNQKGRPRTING
jgi:ATP-dependent DNA helicase RecQ